MEFEEEILAKLDNLNERMNILEKVIYEEVMKPAQEAFDRFETDERRTEFKNKYDEQLSPFNEKLRAIEGDDFDLASKAFDDYDAIEGEKPNSDEYVAELVANVTDQLDKISKAFGAEGDVEVKADVSEDGKVETQIAVDGETVAESTELDKGEDVKEELDKLEKEATDLEEKKEEVKSEDKVIAEEESDKEEDEDDEKELEEFMKELEEDLKKQM